MKTKTCKKCNINKSLEDFYKTKGCKDGYRNSCKKCKIKQNEEYRQKNIEKNKENNKIYYQKNKESIKNRVKKYRSKPENKARRNKQEFLKKSTDINYKISARLRNRIYNAIKNNYKSGSAVKDLGCSVEELKKHLESQFKKGMSWDNWSKKGWHIDHIKPLSSFDLSKREEFLKACHYTNLQPLWAEDNLKKYNKEV